LKAVGEKNIDGDKSALIKKYQDAVLDVGVTNFVEKMSVEQLTKTCKCIGADSKADTKVLKTQIRLEAMKNGLQHLISKGDNDLLKTYSASLGLEGSFDKEGKFDKEEITKQIADEIMLTGMESFFKKLSVSLLQKHCSQLGLTSGGNKKESVER
jgi:hypothetical protein